MKKLLRSNHKSYKSTITYFVQLLLQCKKLPFVAFKNNQSKQCIKFKPNDSQH